MNLNLSLSNQKILSNAYQKYAHILYNLDFKDAEVTLNCDEGKSGHIHVRYDDYIVVILAFAGTLVLRVDFEHFFKNAEFSTLITFSDDPVDIPLHFLFTDENVKKLQNFIGEIRAKYRTVFLDVIEVVSHIEIPKTDSTPNDVVPSNAVRYGTNYIKTN